MKFLFDKHKLDELMIDFYNLTGIRLVVFDSSFTRVAAYPVSDCEFCKKIRSTPKGDDLCVKSDNEAFKYSKDMDYLHVYKCHAGLAEAVFPLKMNDIVIGYIMFGQILDKHEKKSIAHSVCDTDDGFSAACFRTGGDPHIRFLRQNRLLELLPLIQNAGNQRQR